MQELKKSDLNGATALYELGTNIPIRTDYQGIPVFVVPNNMKVETLSNLVEQQLERPYQLQQKVNMLSIESFIDYFNRFATESSTIFVDDNASKFTAVLDYHDSPTEPKHKRHTATYVCPKTTEWNSWTKHNNEKFSQEDFALFIEENLREISNPNGAQMLEIASTLKAKKTSDFKSGIRLDNGEVQFNFTETINGAAGITGQLSIPEKFELVLQPFLKGAAYEVEARFRYRINQGQLVLWYTLIRPHAIIFAAFDDCVKKLTEGINQGHVIHAEY